jgi:NAD(P)H-dependent FMN reductase
VHILAISGSLRRGASNTALLEAAAMVAPPGISVELYDKLAELPHFNPDLDDMSGVAVPEIVRDLRRRVGAADALLLSTPEYAHGLPGSFKNLLDWLVASTEFPGKPIAVISPSARSLHAPAQLREILSTMSARLVADVPIVIEVARRDQSAAAIAGDERLARELRTVLDVTSLAASRSSAARPRSPGRR